MLDHEKDRQIPFPLGEQMKTVCKKCGSDKITQQATIMVNPNDIENGLNWDSVMWEDYFWCDNCEDECGPKEVEQMKFYEAKIEDVREIYPDAVIELDNDGQIIIYTGEWVEIEDMLDTRNQEKE